MCSMTRSRRKVEGRYADHTEKSQVGRRKRISVPIGKRGKTSQEERGGSRSSLKVEGGVEGVEKRKRGQERGNGTKRSVCAKKVWDGATGKGRRMKAGERVVEHEVQALLLREDKAFRVREKGR